MIKPTTLMFRENLRFCLLKQNLQKIKQHGERASDIIKQLKKYTIAGTAHESLKPESASFVNGNN